MFSVKAYREAVNNLMVARTRVVTFAGIFVFMGFSILDHFVYPHLTAEFLAIRVSVSLFFAFGAILSYWEPIRCRIVWLGDILILVVGWGICWMIYRSGGAMSDYFQGLNTVMLGMLVVNTFYLRHSVITGSIILLSYLFAVWESDIVLHRAEVISAYFWMSSTLFFVVLLTKLYVAQHGSEFQKTQEIAEANQKLIEAERLKSEFFANISHELRTPLTLILAPLESLQSEDYGAFNPDQKPVLETMHHNTIRLLQMVTGLLDFSKLEAGKIEVKREAVSIASLTRAILDDFKPLIKKKELTSAFSTNVDEKNVEMDRYLYERILFNLLSNAVKFTPEGGKISVTLNLEGERLNLAVSDTGIGIPKSEIKNLFQKFRQLEGSSTRRFEGTGLGLAMVKEFAALLGGSIAVESEQQKGTLMTVDLYAPEAALQIKKPEMGGNLSRRTQVPNLLSVQKPRQPVEASEDKSLPLVLIAEDNVELAFYMSSLLHKLCRVKIVPNGEVALKQIQSERPDLILSDVMMPKLDGLSLCRKVKSDAELSKIPFVLLTALTNRESLIKGWEAGADEYLYKPFHPKELVTRVRSILLRIQAFNRAEASEQEMKLAMENAVEGMAVYDENGLCLRANEAFSRLLGDHSRDLEGKYWLEKIQLIDQGRAKSAYQEMLKKGKSETSLMGLKQDGTVFKMQLVMVKVPNADKEKRGHYAFIKDVTDAQYKEALDMKSELLSIVSHEMRTPLLTLREGVWAINSGLMGEINQAQRDALEIVHKSADRLVRLVNRILDYQKLDAGKMELHIEKADINDIIQDVKKNMDSLIQHKDVSIQMELSDQISGIEIDKDRIMQVIFNLLDNAIKFTNQGEVCISSLRRNGFIEVAVRDSGIGIKEEDIPRLFRNFVQLETGKVQAPRRGTGLGLAISKKIIEQHQGKMWVESAYQKGSTFFFTLPAVPHTHVQSKGNAHAA